MTAEENVQTHVNSAEETVRNPANGIGANGFRAPAPATRASAHSEKMVRDNGRYLRILIFFGRIILHVIWWDLLVGRMPLAGNWVRSTRPNRSRNWARKFRTLAIEMGGVMIKL